MKKLVSLTLAVLFVMMVAAVAFAAETTFEGQYRVRAWSEWNFDKKAGYTTGHGDPQYNGWFDQRFRLTITHTRSEFLKAVVRLDLAEDTWGQGRAFRINNNGHGFGAGSFIDLAYLEFSLPKIGTFTVGRFPQDFGNGLIYSSGGFWFGSDGIKWENTWGPVTASAMYIKYIDDVTLGNGDLAYNRDADLWAIDLKVAPNEKHLIELFGGALISNRAWTPNAGIEGSYNVLAKYNNYGTPVAADANMTIGFVGLAYTGNIADMIDIKLENSWIFGGMHYNTPVAGLDDDLSVGGWNIYADVSYYNDLLRVGLAFLMGSGDKHDWAITSVHHVNMTHIREDNFWWSNIIGGGYGGGNSVYWNGPGYGGNAENLTSAKLYFEITPLCCDGKLSFNAAVVWAKWTDPIGSGPRVLADGPAYPHPANWYSNYNFNSWDASTDLGWEFDLGFSYEIMEGLTYTFSGGVLLTGDSWDYVDDDGTREEWGPIWSFSNVLQYNF